MSSHVCNIRIKEVAPGHNNKLRHRRLESCVPRGNPHALNTSKASKHFDAQAHPSNKTTQQWKMLLEEVNWTLKQACFQGYPESAVNVQVPIGSRNPAIHNAYHTSLRPSSLFEPRHQSLKVVRRKWRTTSTGRIAKNISQAKGS